MLSAFWCTYTVTALLTMPEGDAVAVTVAVPTGPGLQWMKVESHAPAQTAPEGETDAKLGALEL
jgi:hypothetical protein